MTLPYIKPQLQHKGNIIQAQLLMLMSTCLLVSSCCSPGIRPDEANLFQAMCGLSSGEFESQLEDDKIEAASSQQALDTEKSKSQDLKSDLETSKAELENLLKELDELENENRRIEAQISNMQTDTAEARQERTQLQTKLETIQDQLEALKHKASVEQDAFEQYDTEKSRLKQEIDVLRMIISAQ